MAEYVDFDDGTVHAASVRFTNPKAQAISYSGRFYLAVASDLTTPINTPVVVPFTVPAQVGGAPGAAIVLFDNVITPLLAVQTANFIACLQVSVAGVPLVTFTGVKIVRVTFRPGIGWGDIAWT